MINTMHFRKQRLAFGGGQDGFTIPAVISIMLAALILGAAVLTVIINNFFVIGNSIKSQQAFNIAEAGINYYMWHLSHNSTDYKDGQTTPTTPTSLGYGPYVHNYVDDSAKTTGTYTLYISPQGSGSTIVTIRSIGKVNGTNITRTIQAQIGATSFANYGVVSDTALWFGANETADGPVFSNQGVRMDGTSTSTVGAANATYIPPVGLGGDGTTSHPGVWCDISVTAPVNCATRSKVDWQFPSTSVDFNQVSSSLCTIKKVAFAADSATASLASQSNACTQTPATRTAAYLPQRSSSVNSTRGYLLVLNTNNTYNLYLVNNENDTVSSGGYGNALVTQTVASNIAVPASGVVFAEDNVWVVSNPTFHGRLTIAAGRLASSQNASIVVAGPLLYSTKNGQDAIGLVAEQDIRIAPYAAPSSGAFTLEVDAASLAQNGSVMYPSNYSFSNTDCSRGWVNSNQKLLYYGSVASRQSWTWSWQYNSQCGDNVRDPVSGNYISGFLYNTTQYDYNLLYAPPPSYPITGGYNILSWREVLTHP